MILAAAVRRSGLDAFSRARGDDSVEFPHFLANHAPMVGHRAASPRRFRIVLWNGSNPIGRPNGLVAPPPPVAPIDARTWDAALGDRARETDYRVFFTAEVRRLGIDGATRRDTAPPLSGRRRERAASADAPRLRDHRAMTGEKPASRSAIGPPAICSCPRPTGASRTPRTPRRCWARRRDRGRQGLSDRDRIFSGTISAPSRRCRVPPCCRPARIRADAPRRMAATSLALFVGTMDFAALHAVTGLHWARLVSPCSLDDAEPLYRAFWQAIAALGPEDRLSGIPSRGELARMRNTRRRPGPRSRRRRSASNDEHDISLTFSARRRRRSGAIRSTASSPRAGWADPMTVR